MSFLGYFCFNPSGCIDGGGYEDTEDFLALVAFPLKAFEETTMSVFHDICTSVWAALSVLYSKSLIKFKTKGFRKGWCSHAEIHCLPSSRLHTMETFYEMPTESGLDNDQLFCWHIIWWKSCGTSTPATPAIRSACPPTPPPYRYLGKKRSSSDTSVLGRLEARRWR